MTELKGRTYGSSDYDKIIETYPKWRKRFWDKVLSEVEGDECWLWTAGTNDAGYGVFGVYKKEDRPKGMKLEYSHRLTWMLFHEEVPEGYVVDHKCFNRKCCNPDHLQAIPHYENCAQGAKEKPNCGTCGDVKYRLGNGRLSCKRCADEAMRKYRLKKRKSG